MPIQQLAIRKMNQDLDESLLNQTDELGMVRYAYNIRTLDSESGSVGVATNVKGNLLVSYSLPSGGNRVVGSFSDVKNKRVYYLVWNSNDTHSLLEYDETTQAISLIFQGEALELTEDLLLKSIRTIDTSEGTAILWTDGVTEPKKVYRETGIRTFDLGLAGVSGTNTGNFNPSFATYNEGQCFKANATASGVTEGLYYLAKTNTSQDPEDANGNLNSDWEYMPVGYIYKFDSISGNDITIPSERISRMPQAPLEPLEAEYGTDETKTINNLRQSCWQFTYKYIYFDGQESHAAPWSNVPLIDSNTTSSEGAYYVSNNFISLPVYLDLDQDIESVVIYAQSFNNDNTKFDASLYKISKTIDVNSVIASSTVTARGLSYNYNFYNTEERIAANPVDLQQLYYNVPIKSGTMEITSSNRVIDGDVTEGYDVAIPDLDTAVTSVEFYDYPSSSDSTITATLTPPDLVIDFGSVTYSENDVVRLNIEISASKDFVLIGVYPLSKRYKVQSGDTASDIANYFASKTEVYPFNGLNATVVGDELTLSNFTSRYFWNINSNFSVSKITGSVEKNIKSLSSPEYAIAYYDKYGRVTSAVSNDFLRADVPINQEGANYGVKIYVNNTPPEEAVKFAILRKKNSGWIDFVQFATSIENTDNPNSLNDRNYFIQGKISVNADGAEVRTNGEYLYIYLNGLNGDAETAFINDSGADALAYSYTEGDRLRFIRGTNLSTGAPTNWYGDDVPILAYNQTFNRVKVRYSDLPSALQTIFDSTNEAGTANAEAKGFVCEIYTPDNSNDESFYYETGDVYDISGGFHQGTIQNQTATAPAILVTSKGQDSYFKGRGYYINSVDGFVQYYLEDPNMSDQYLSKCTDLGRGNIEYRAALTDESVSGQISQQRNEGKLIYSEAFDETTLLNRLGTVYSLNFTQVDQTFGDVQHLHSEGDKLDVYQKDRVALIYIDRSVTTALGGDSSVLQSNDTVLSNYQYYAQENGIADFPTSFASNGNRRYFVDAARGKVLRKSMDGITPISDYGMAGYFNTKLKNINTNGGEIIGWYDIRFDEYVLNLKFNSTSSITPSDYIGAGATEARITFPSSVYMSQFVEGTQLSLQGVTRVYSGEIIDVGSDYVDVDLGLAIDKTELLADTSTTDVLSSETLAFNESVRGWVTFYGYIPDWADGGTIDMVSWKEGQLYTHNSGDYNNFYGEDFTSNITFIGNETPATKFFKTFQVRAQNIHYAEEILTSPEIETSLGQQSDFIGSDFKYKEGNMFAGFWRDKNTPNVTFPAINGDTLRGRWISVNLQLEAGVNKLVKFLQATFNYENSSESY